MSLLVTGIVKTIDFKSIVVYFFKELPTSVPFKKPEFQQVGSNDVHQHNGQHYSQIKERQRRQAHFGRKWQIRQRKCNCQP